MNESSQIVDSGVSSAQAFYLEQIKAYEKAANKWYEQCRKIAKRYKAEGSNTGAFNVLWPNVETMRPALFAKPPLPYVERRFKDKDRVGVKASEVLERCVSTSLEQNDIAYLGSIMIRDYLLNGRGVSWERYEPVITNGAQISGAAEEKLSYEYACTDYLPLEDFGHSVARHWGEVRCVWRKAYLSKSQVAKRFPDHADSIDYDHRHDDGESSDSTDKHAKACIFEIWDKELRKVCFVAKGAMQVLESIDPPVNLSGFFPCPRPIYATLAGNSLIPTPDYVLYQEQAKEIDMLTQRIARLTSALRLAGVYDADVPALADLVNEGTENILIPVDSYAKLADRGGLEKAVSFLPIKEVAEVLIRLYESRERAKQDLYEKTGIADIIRGATDAQETATSQQIKSQFATLRLSERQRDVQRYLRDVVRLKAEIIAEAFDPETVKAMSGVKLLTRQQRQELEALMQQAQMAQQPPPVPGETLDLMAEPDWEDVLELLKNDPVRTFRIDIETDSTIQADEQADKQARMEFVTALTQGMTAAAEIGQSSPHMLKLMGKAMQFAARGFKNARELEVVLDESLEAVQKQIENPPPPPPDPEMEKAKAQMAIEREKLNMEREKLDMQSQADQRKAQLEEQKVVREMELKTWQAEQDAVIKQGQAETKASLDAMKAEQQNALAGFKESARAELAEKALALKSESGEEKEATKQRDAYMQDAVEKIFQNQLEIAKLLESLQKPKRRRAVVDGETIEIHVEDLN